jgi:hypothetical protein
VVVSEAAAATAAQQQVVVLVGTLPNSVDSRRKKTWAAKFLVDKKAAESISLFFTEAHGE